jgi:hypothetical protein
LYSKRYVTYKEKKGTGKVKFLFWGEYFYSFFRNILIFFFLCGKNNLLYREIPAMSIWRTSELAGRKGVRSGSKGGSIPGVIPVWICRSMPELNPYFLPFSQVRSSFSRYLNMKKQRVKKAIQICTFARTTHLCF